MNVGELNQRIKIYKQGFEKNHILGTDKPAKILVREVWAKVSPRTGSLLSGREAGTILSKTTHAISVRQNVLKDIDDACWIEWIDGIGANHFFEIDYILPPSKEKFATIYASEKVINNGV